MSENEILMCKEDGSFTTREKFREQFERNLKNCPTGWASEFEDFDACVKAWFR